jgi:hypothetical protein
MGLAKANALINNGEKELLKVLIHGKKRSTFLGKEVLQKMCEKSCKKKCRRVMLFSVCCRLLM